MGKVFVSICEKHGSTTPSQAIYPDNDVNVYGNECPYCKLDEREWISVEDRLPSEDLDHVLIVVSDGIGTFVTKGFHDGDKWHSDTFDSYYTNNHTTHWMPLPSPPGDNNEG